MSATLLHERAGSAIYHADWRALLSVVERCDALIVDAPYSERTHTAHDDGAQTANKKAREGKAEMAHAAGGGRRSFNYTAWTPDDVEAFVSAWAPRVGGWIVSLTDHVLAPAWERALVADGRYVFSPLACVEPCSRVRMVGDGPAQWSCWAVVARPRSQRFKEWGSLPGAYVVPPGQRGEWRGAYGGQRVVGGKPQWLMDRLVEDYSRPGDLVIDPCCGAGTTVLAAMRTGRRGIGGDAMREHAELAASRLRAGVQAPLFTEGT